MAKKKRGKKILAAGVAVAASVAVYLALTEDQIKLAKTGSDSATILVDGNRSACVNDEIQRGDIVKVGNLLPAGICNSETVVFAQENAMRLVSPDATWTQASGDVETINLSPLLTVPLTVWLLTGIPNDPVVNASRASQIYNQMQVGLQFSVAPTDLHDVRPSTLNEAGCENLGPLEGAYPPLAQQLNVYYVQKVTKTDTVSGVPFTYEVNGRWCENDPNIVLIGSFAEETLAHELGHALTLAHSDSALQLTTNLMFSQSNPRDSLTIGQAFRVNVNDRSAINVNHLRTGPTRSCPDSTADSLCPSITLDAQPK